MSDEKSQSFGTCGFVWPIETDGKGKGLIILLVGRWRMVGGGDWWKVRCGHSKWVGVVCLPSLYILGSFFRTFNVHQGER